MAQQQPARQPRAAGHASPCPNRSRHARAATPIASSASATPLAGRQHRPELDLQRGRAPREMRPDRSARCANRRSQPRTVSAANPSRAAIGRCPCPPTCAAIAAPITATSSCRRSNAQSGNSTCVPAQPRHRARRGRSTRSPRSPRITRSRAWPHGPNTPQHDGHASPPPQAHPRPPPPRRIRSTSVPPPASKRALPTQPAKLAGGLSRVYERAKPASTVTTTNSATPAARAQSQRRRSRRGTGRGWPLGRIRPRRAADRLCQFDQLSRWLAREGLAGGRADGGAGGAVLAGASRGWLCDVVLGRAAWRCRWGICGGLGAVPARRYGRGGGARWRSCSPITAGTCWSSAGCAITRCSTGTARGALVLPSARRGRGWAGAVDARGGELVPGSRVPKAQRVRGAGSGLRAAVVVALPAPGGVDRERRWCGRCRRWPICGIAPCRAAWNRPRCAGCWPAVIGAGRWVGATTRSCCCWRGWGYGPARSPRSPWRTSTGARGAARPRQGRPGGRVAVADRCRRGGRRRICAVVRGASAGHCSCG